MAKWSTLIVFLNIFGTYAHNVSIETTLAHTHKHMQYKHTHRPILKSLATIKYTVNKYVLN